MLVINSIIVTMDATRTVFEILMDKARK